MLGKNYFETRAKLETAVHKLAELAERGGISPARVSLLRNLMANLKDPFLFVVVGEVNAGKSTLLNAIFGEDFCSADVLPTTDTIACFKHGEESHEFEVNDTLMEVYRPNEFLKDFNIVDTPGTNSIELDHQQITEQFLPMADLVIFTFSVTNPWGATTWDLLDRIHNQWKKKILFVLQQCDLRTDEEVSAILEHLQKTAAHKFGVRFPTFAVSAKQAFMSKTDGLDTEALWEASNFGGLEQFISDVVESSETRLTKLINAWRAACYVLGETRDKLGTASEIIRADNELLSGLNLAATQQEERTQRKFELLFEALDKSYMAAGLQAEPLLEARLTPIGALRPPGEVPEQVESLIFASTMKAVRRNANDGAHAVQDDVVQLWERLAEEMQEHFNLQLSVGETGIPDWDKYRDGIAKAVENSTAEVLRDLDLASQLRQLLVRRSRIMWTFISIALLGALVGSVMAFLQFSPWYWIPFGVCGLSLILGILLGSAGVVKTRRAFADLLEEKRASLTAVQRRSFRDGVSEFYEKFVRLFDPLRTVCQQHREKYEPQLQEIEMLENTLLELEEVLTPVEQALAARAKN